MSIFDTLDVDKFKEQFPRFMPMYLSDIEYVEDKTYFKDDIVYYETKFYVSKKDNNTSLPAVTTDWDLYNDSVLNYTRDDDIENAFNEAKINFNEGLFGDDEKALMMFLYLTAHYLTIDFRNATGTNQIGIMTSKSVGSVSQGYTIPAWINNSKALSVYATTGYGIKYASLLRPYLVGNVMLLKGRTTIA